jgi:hypothetical protein
VSAAPIVAPALPLRAGKVKGVVGVSERMAMTPRLPCAFGPFSYGVVALFVAGACSRDSTDRTRTFGPASATIQEARGDVTLKVPMQSCTKSVSHVGRLRELASLVPRGLRKDAQPQDEGWEPGRLADVATAGQQLLVLDRGTPSITLVSDAFRKRRTLGRTGTGPSEFRNPVSVAADSVRRRFAVADVGNRRLLLLDFDGVQLESFPLDVGNVEDIALADSTILVAHFIIPELLGENSPFGSVLSVLHPPASRLKPVIPVHKASLDRTRFPLPGPNPSRIVATGNLSLLFSPTTGRVEVLRNDSVVASYKVCMPPKLWEAYQRQLARFESGRQGNSQQSYPLITDVLVLADTVFAVGPMPDQAQRFHIDRFLLDGTDIGSLVAPLDGMALPLEIRFWGSPTHLLAFGPHGTMIELAYE